MYNREKAHEYYMRNKEKAHESCRRYYVEHAEECRARSRAYYYAHRKHCIERSAEYRKTHPETDDYKAYKSEMQRLRYRDDEEFRLHKIAIVKARQKELKEKGYVA